MSENLKTIYSPDGIDVLVLENLYAQVSGYVAQHNNTHSFEMLPKSPREIQTQFEKGLSVIQYQSENNNLIFHATAYPSLTKKQAKVLGFQIYEAGTVIVNPDYRGRGIGTNGSRLLSDHIHRLNHYITVWLATNKEADAFLAMTNGGRMHYADFYQLPHLTYLTCTCNNCSERSGYSSCLFRRQSYDIPDTAKLRHSLQQGRGKMPCTLIVSDLQAAQRFESKCRELRTSHGLGPLAVGILSLDIIKEIDYFFHMLNE